nr:universal stress protein [uncultured Desulfobulbus sp.]
MEKILVAIDARHGAWAALSHACSLAKRMEVELNVLLITPLSTGRTGALQNELDSVVKKRLQLLLETAKTEGITVNYFMTEGSYEDEVIDFVNHHKIALLVHETRGKDARSAAKEAIALRALRHRLHCKVEVVAPIKTVV